MGRKEQVGRESGRFRRRGWGGDGIEDPVEVGGGGGVDVEDEELGKGVGMECVEGGFEGVEAGGGGFDDEEDFGGALDAALPAVEGLDLRNEVNAGGEALLDEGGCDAFGFFEAGGGGEGDACFGHGIPCEI